MVGNIREDLAIRGRRPLLNHCLQREAKVLTRMRPWEDESLL